MAEEGYITPGAARQAFDEPLNLQKVQDDFSDNGYYIQQVSNYINSKYGQKILTTGGLTVYTCLDPAIQHKADLAVKRGITSFSDLEQNRNPPQAAMAVLETATGKVRAVVGGLDFSSSQFDRAVQARRQPGSSFKPIVYATALEHGFKPDSIVIDEPVSLKGAVSGQIWEPKNFDNRYYGPTTLQEGLIFSRNIIAIKLLQEVGPGRVIKMARNLGIQSPIKPDLTMALGSSGISLLEMTGAYSAFANRGNYLPPIFIEKIVDRHGRILEENFPGRMQAMSEKAAVQMDRMLQKVISRGTGRKAQGLKVIAAGKTGTTDNNMDAWFIGYTPDFLAGVWVGYDKNISLGKNVSGGQVAAPIWLDFMKMVEAGD
jgi:penicillin-binding protein 1A